MPSPPFLALAIDYFGVGTRHCRLLRIIGRATGININQEDKHQEYTNLRNPKL